MPEPVERHITKVLDALAAVEDGRASVRDYVLAGEGKRSSEAWLASHLTTLMAALLRQPAGQQPSAIHALVEECQALDDGDRLAQMTDKKMKVLLRRPYFGLLAPTSYAIAVRDGCLPAPDELAITSVSSSASGAKVYGACTKAPHPRLDPFLDDAYARFKRVDRNAAGTSHLVVVWAVTHGEPELLVPIGAFFLLAGSNLDPRERHRRALERQPDVVMAAARVAAGFPADYPFHVRLREQLETLLDWLDVAARAAGHDPFADSWWTITRLSHPTAEHRDARVAIPRAMYVGDDLESMAALQARGVRAVAQSFLFGQGASPHEPVLLPPPVWVDGRQLAEDEQAFASPDWRELAGLPLMRAATGLHGTSPEDGVAGSAFVRAGLMAAPSAWRTLWMWADDAELEEAAHVCERAFRRDATLRRRCEDVPTATAKESGPDRETLAACALLREQLDLMDWSKG